MGDDSDDESELLAALSAFSVNNALSSSGSDDDDDGMASVDTSAVARLLAGRQSSDTCDFGALADALQTAAAVDSSTVLEELLPDELQVTSTSLAPLMRFG
jgi:hypothetical protein